MGIALVLVTVAFLRAADRIQNPDHAFPDVIQAVFDRVVFDLNGVEDHLQLVFTIHNRSNFDLRAERRHDGVTQIVLGGVNFPLLTAWHIETEQPLGLLPKSTMSELTLTRILEINLGAQFAYGDPDLPNTAGRRPAVFNLGESAVPYVAIKNLHRRGEIRFPTTVEVRPSISPHHWQRYRHMHELLRGSMGG